MLWMALYAGLTVAMLLLAMASGVRAYQLQGCCLALSCLLCNLATGLFGFDHAPVAMPMIDVLVAILCMAVEKHWPSPAGRFVITLFGAEALTHVIFFLRHAEGTYAYYALLNVIFACQVIQVGGAAGVDVAYDRIWSVSAGLHPVRHGGAGFGARAAQRSAADRP
jgi:hypothetical protein